MAQRSHLSVFIPNTQSDPFDALHPHACGRDRKARSPPVIAVMKIKIHRVNPTFR
jgi:hypothetical protein